jgi:hypothetical protein
MLLENLSACGGTSGKMIGRDVLGGSHKSPTFEGVTTKELCSYCWIFVVDWKMLQLQRIYGIAITSPTHIPFRYSSAPSPSR